MNTLVIVLIAACCLVAGYVFYGRWLANKWGIDPKAKTPAVTKNDGQDYVPTDGWVVFAHQFSSIAGAGPVTGAIQAAVFGWVPVFLWILLGGIFFGAVTDFGALYASVKNEGRSMGLLIEQYIGKTGKKLFLLFCWLFTLIVIAAFADMVAGTFNAYTVVDGVSTLSDAAVVNGAAGSISLLFIVFAVIFGLIQKKMHFTGWKEIVLGLVCTIAAFVIGMNCPLVTTKTNWSLMVFAYIFLAAVLPMWLLMQPRDFMTTFMFAGMIIGAVLGLVVAHPTMNLPGLHRISTMTNSWRPVSDPVCHRCLRRRIRIPQSGILRYIFQDRSQRKRHCRKVGLRSHGYWRSLTGCPRPVRSRRRCSRRWNSLHAGTPFQYLLLPESPDSWKCSVSPAHAATVLHDHVRLRPGSDQSGFRSAESAVCPSRSCSAPMTWNMQRAGENFCATNISPPLLP